MQIHNNTISEMQFILYYKFSHFAVPTPVTALDTNRLSSTSLQVTWDLPEVLNGILVYYDVNVSSISVGYFETWRIQADDPLQLNISGLGINNYIIHIIHATLYDNIFCPCKAILNTIKFSYDVVAKLAHTKGVLSHRRWFNARCDAPFLIQK